MSGEPDRGLSVERALRRVLANSPDTSSGTCLDAETLATWADNGLDAGERTRAEAHTAGCARCQALLAALVRTTPDAAPPIPWWRSLGMGWLVPLAATATALVVWIAVPGPAPDRTTSPPLPSAIATQTARPEPAKGSVGSQASAASGANPAAREGREEKSTALAVASERRDAKTTVVASVDRQVVSAEPPSALAPAERHSTVTAGTPERARTAAEAASKPAASPPTVPASPAPAAVANSFAKTTRADAVAIEIASPDSMIRWRISGGRIVEQSIDGGSTWAVQPVGAAVDLTAGAAPSATVCWLVGRSGTVVLTVDGRQWQRVASPAPVDLAAVQAADARTAIVTTVDGQRFRTTDGGRTWNR